MQPMSHVVELGSAGASTVAPEKLLKNSPNVITRKAQRAKKKTRLLWLPDECKNSPLHSRLELKNKFTLESNQWGAVSMATGGE